MNLGCKYIFGFLIGLLFAVFGFIFPNQKNVNKPKISVSEIDSLLYIAKKNISISKKINLKVDSITAITDCLIKYNETEVTKLRYKFIYEDSFLIFKKDSIVSEFTTNF